MEIGRFRILILWLQWIFLRRPSVILIDYDDKVFASLARGWGRYRWAKRFGMGICTVRLNEDGTTVGNCYTKRWEPLFPRQSH